MTTSPVDNQSTLQPLPYVESSTPSSGLTPQFPSATTSHYRAVFQTTSEMKEEFVKFLKTIFFQLDEIKVLKLMEEILADPNKTDEQIYAELLKRINETKKTVPILSRLWSLFVLKTGLGRQADELLKPYRKEAFHSYMEIYDRRYANTLRKNVKLPLDKDRVAVCDSDKVDFSAKILAGSIFSAFPYTKHVCLNESTCKNPLLEPETTYKPIGDEIQNTSIDLIGCFGGLHHIPKERVEPFVKSMHSKLKPGGVVLLRDHDACNDKIVAIASVVHSFVNAANGESSAVETKEVREFKSAAFWTRVMEKQGFKRVSAKALILKDDPTQNAMMAFSKTPQTKADLLQLVDTRVDCQRPREGSRSTWIEWGNVRFAKDYAAFIQNHHAYAFNYIGYMRQHWKHFYHFFKESLKDTQSLKASILNEGMAMNLFILLAATVQCSIGSLTNLPSALYARYRFGKEWRQVVNLTAMEKFEAHWEKEYSETIDTIPFYMLDYIDKIKEVWQIVWNTPDDKFLNLCSGISNTISFAAKALVSAPIKAFYTQEANKEPDTIKMIVLDNQNKLDGIIQRWKSEKDPKDGNIEVLETTSEGYKLVSLPRYRPFTKIMSYLRDEPAINLLSIGNREKITVDLLTESKYINTNGTLIYETDKIDDTQKRRYQTYEVKVTHLTQFLKEAQNTVDYIHE